VFVPEEERNRNVSVLKKDLILMSKVFDLGVKVNLHHWLHEMHYCSYVLTRVPICMQEWKTSFLADRI